MANDTPLVIVGNLTADPELRITRNGLPVSKFIVASTPRTFDKTTGQYVDGETLFMTCAAWRDLAEHVTESLTKGARVIVSGRLRQSRWETPEGEKRSAYQLDVDEIGPSLRFATAAVKKMVRSNGGPNAMAPDDPFATAAPASVGTRNHASTDGSGSGGGFDNDEPPF